MPSAVSFNFYTDSIRLCACVYVSIACKFTLVADGNDTYVKAWKAVSEQPYFKKSL